MPTSHGAQRREPRHVVVGRGQPCDVQLTTPVATSDETVEASRVDAVVDVQRLGQEAQRRAQLQTSDGSSE